MSYKNLQHYRYTVHRYLDAIWSMGYNKRKTRTSMYKLLSNKMDLDIDDTHVSKFTRAQCKQAISILRPMYIQLYGQDLTYTKKRKEEIKMNLQTTCTQTFETAHILPKTDTKYDGLYSRTYKLKVIVEGPQIQPVGMIIPQEELKEILSEAVPDRQFIFNINNPVCKEISDILKRYEIPYIELDKEVVAENLIQYLKDRIEYYLYDVYKYSKDIKIVEMELSSIKEEYSTKLILN